MPNITKKELLEKALEELNKYWAIKIAEKTGLDFVDAWKTIEGLIEVVSGLLAAGHSVKLHGFGTFQIKKRKAWIQWNNWKKAYVSFPEEMDVCWIPAKELKKQINSADRKS